MTRFDIAGLAVLAATVPASLFAVASLGPVSTLAFAGFAGWLVAPHLIFALVWVRRGRGGRWPRAYMVVAMCLALAGLAVLVDIIWLRPDPQGGLAVLMVPVLQVLGYALIGMVMAAAARRAR